MAPNRIVAKVSRVEVATKFMSPPPQRFLDQLLAEGFIDEDGNNVGPSLSWPTRDLTFTLHVGGTADVVGTNELEVLRRSFGAWGYLVIDAQPESIHDQFIRLMLNLIQGSLIGQPGQEFQISV